MCFIAKSWKTKAKAKRKIRHSGKRPETRRRGNNVGGFSAQKKTIPKMYMGCMNIKYPLLKVYQLN